MLLKRDDVNPDNQVAVAGRHSIVLLGMDMGVVKMLLEQDGVNPDKPAILRWWRCYNPGVFGCDSKFPSYSFLLFSCC